MSFSGTTVTYTYAPGEAQAAVTIAWDDIDDLDRIRPASVDVVIRSEDGNGTKLITLSETDDWRGTIDLDAALTYDKANVVMTEVITGEDTETTYAVDGMGNQTQGFFFRLTHTPKLPGVSGEIVWDDDDNYWGKRPDSVEVTLWARLSDGNVVDMSQARDVEGNLVPKMTKTVSAQDNWKVNFVFEKVPVAYNGEAFTWFLKQNPGTVDGYREATADGMRVTNSYIRPRSITINVKKPAGVDASVTVESGATATEVDNQFTAYEGDTIILTVSKPGDCELSLTAVGADDSPVPIEDNSFTVPKCDVTVDAVFKLQMGLTVSLEGWTYGDEPNTPVVDGKADSAVAAIAYKSSEEGSEWSAEAPTEAGNYTVKATVEETEDYLGGEATADFTISKANPTVTPPTAADGLHYTGSAQPLVNAGEAIGGTMHYSLDGENWSADIPTGTDLGNYEVWYKVVGDTNHNDTDPASVNVAIAFTVPYFSDAALELGGILNLRFYVAYPESWDTANDRVVFTVNGVPHTVTYAESDTDTTGQYFPCPVDAFQMADLITARYYHGEDEVDRKVDYSVKKNLEYLNGKTSGNTQALVQAAMDFGCYIQPYLAGRNHWTVGKDHVAMTPYNTNLTPLAEVSDEYKHTATINSDYVQNAVFGLSTYQDNVLEVTVVLKDDVTGSITGTVNGQDVTPASAGDNAYKLVLNNLPANALATAYPFTLSVDGTEVFRFTASALSYVRIVLPQSKTDAQKLALTALYNYALAAQAYKPN